MSSRNTTGGGQGTTKDVHGVLHLKGHSKATPGGTILPGVDPSVLLDQLRSINSRTAPELVPDDMYSLPAGMAASTPALARALLSVLSERDLPLATQRAHELAACRTPEGREEIADIMMEDMDDGAPDGHYYGAIDGAPGTLGFWPLSEARFLDQPTESALG